MNERARYLIRKLKLKPHPEGGYFNEVFRSPHRVQPDGDRPERSALTIIYFLLTDGQYSCLHRVRSDEVWHFLEGDPLQLIWLEGSMKETEKVSLGSAGGNREPVVAVPADCWQTAYTEGKYTLVSCSVGPGFEFEDFEMLRDNGELIKQLKEYQPDLKHLV